MGQPIFRHREFCTHTLKYALSGLTVQPRQPPPAQAHKDTKLSTNVCLIVLGFLQQQHFCAHNSTFTFVQAEGKPPARTDHTPGREGRKKQPLQELSCLTAAACSRNRLSVYCKYTSSCGGQQFNEFSAFQVTRGGHQLL